MLRFFVWVWRLLEWNEKRRADRQSRWLQEIRTTHAGGRTDTDSPCVRLYDGHVWVFSQVQFAVGDVDLECIRCGETRSAPPHITEAYYRESQKRGVERANEAYRRRIKRWTGHRDDE